ncbi:forkhead box protein P3-like isoform X1 [Xiphophorus maculatus]|uniref:Forkhead box protein P3-like n=1 Tax=Xiphophorus maculatus TaxID=8083 RepID=M4AEK4_XIPMA|nr:forkhead box protein P3-like isoform X1 [Xiphophorus maculatus]XP_023197622.1 forkhead box protein P3-like isoform X1 [Xiphophorus maculatus]
MDEIQKHKQRRPSVLRHVPQAASRQQHDSSGSGSLCKEEVDTDHLSWSNSSQTLPNPSLYLLSPRGDNAKQPSVKIGLNNGIPEGMSALFVSGLCRWPGCGVILENFSTFLKHLHSEHRHNDKSIAQWRVQQDIVQYMERQLVLEKQKLLAMQLHLSENSYSTLAQVINEDRIQLGELKNPNQTLQHDWTAKASTHLLPDLFPGIECYKYNNIRPPYTYAYLIRWSILESPDKQRTLNEIYNWFTTMFFYFRHNTATWKNAIRHNLSLHKCFVRVEGEKGAVWTVDETEYQRRKGQKYHRDCPVKWLTSYSHFCSEEPTAADSSTVSLLLSRC